MIYKRETLFLLQILSRLTERQMPIPKQRTPRVVSQPQESHWGCMQVFHWDNCVTQSTNTSQLIAYLHLEKWQGTCVQCKSLDRIVCTHSPRCNITTKVKFITRMIQNYKVFYYNLHSSRLAQRITAENYSSWSPHPQHVPQAITCWLQTRNLNEKSHSSTE